MGVNAVNDLKVLGTLYLPITVQNSNQNVVKKTKMAPKISQETFFPSRDFTGTHIKLI